MKKTILIVAILAVIVGVCSFLFYKKEKAEQAEQTTQVKSDKWSIKSVKAYNVMGICIDTDSTYTEAMEALISDKLTYASVPVSINLEISNENNSIEETDSLQIDVKMDDIAISQTAAPVKINGQDAELNCEFDARDIVKKDNNINSVIKLIKNIRNKDIVNYSIKKK